MARKYEVKKLMTGKYVGPAILVLINFASAAMAFKVGDWKKGIYFLSSAICIGMVAVQ